MTVEQVVAVPMVADTTTPTKGWAVTFYRGRATPLDAWLNDASRERAAAWVELGWEVEVAEGRPGVLLIWRPWP